MQRQHMFNAKRCVRVLRQCRIKEWHSLQNSLADEWVEMKTLKHLWGVKDFKIFHFSKDGTGKPP